MEGVSSKSHGDFYCYGCLHSFCTLSALKTKEDKNIKQYVLGAISLRMNSVIYADFESILLPYSTCDKENVTSKKLNKQVPCVYSINVVTNHNKQSKQTYYRRNATLQYFVMKYVILHKIY